MRNAALATLIAILMLAAGCAQPELRDLRSTGEGPDAFITVPRLPLQMPQDLAHLPAPLAGGANRTDPRPRDDAIIALGGRPGAEAGTAAPGQDAALLAHTGRNGIAAAIRNLLAQEDADFRRRKARFTNIRLFLADRYNQAYRREALRPQEVAAQLRAAGIALPSAPSPQDRDR